MAKRWNEYSDDDLYHLLFKGSSTAEQAFSEIYNRHSSKIFTFCRYFLGSYDDASDVFQETFIKFHRTKKPEKVMTNMSGYLLQIARNLCINYIRDRKPEIRYEEYLDPAAGIEDHKISEQKRKQLGKLLKESLRQLNDEYREIFILREYDGLSYKEIADVLDESMDTVKVRLFRAKKQMRKILEPQLNKMELE